MNIPSLIQNDQGSIIEVRNLTKIFGPRPQKTLSHLQRGCSVKEIREKTGHIVRYRTFRFKSEGEIFVLWDSRMGTINTSQMPEPVIEPKAGEILLDGEDLSLLLRTR
jgi:glycine betaine/proline transport system ATP-binding protein